MSEHCKAFIIKEDNMNLSVAWAKTFLAALEPRRDLVPLVVRIGAFNNGTVCEDAVIRKSLDQNLFKMGKQCCHTVANTIFPESLWNCKKDRSVLYERYKKSFPRLKAVESRNNLGLYFERLIAYEPDENSNINSNKSNQLEYIIRTYGEVTHRRSVLQAAIFDPRRDHNKGPYLKFPCLQHVTFVPCGEQGIVVNGFYAMQYLFKRAYGNYLGLCRLGNFVAHELGLELVQMNCTIGVGKVDVKSCDIKNLMGILKDRLSQLEKN
jgi:thymidylate synthase